MPRMDGVIDRLASLELSGKRIVYLISEERDILREVFSKAAAYLKPLGGNKLKPINNASDTDFFDALSEQSLIVDVYDMIEPLRGPTKTNPEKSIFSKPYENAAFMYMSDFHLFCTGRPSLDPGTVFLLNYIKNVNSLPMLFLVAPVLKLPDGFQDDIEIIDVPGIDAEDIGSILFHRAEHEKKKIADKRKIEREDLNNAEKDRIRSAVKDFKGLTVPQLDEVLNHLSSQFGCFFGISPPPDERTDYYDEIAQERAHLTTSLKRRLAASDSTVTLLESGSVIEGLSGYRDWLDDVKDAFLDQENALKWGLLPPKGVLLSGITGSGKTQAAKLTAAKMGVTLVQFRMDNILGGLVGDSEANFKRCRKRIEALAPCVVLLDEIEKTFDTSDSKSSDVKMNLFTALLDWMQENEKPVFFFATSNSVQKLRPELLRDGRFSMRFSVFMPTHDELVKIIRYHLGAAQERAGGGLYQENVRFDELAEGFLNEITDKSRIEGLNMFYTGANIESLIELTNRTLKREGKERPVYKGAILNTMIKCAQSKYSQPYGMTNMKSIAGFWIDALENKYTDAGGPDLFPFSGFDEKTFLISPQRKSDHKYDKWLFKQISEQIREIMEKRKNEVDTWA